MRFERHFHFRMFKSFLFTFLAIALFFTLIEYSTHLRVFNGASFKDTALYFAARLSSLLEILLPLALLISMLWTVGQAFVKNELLALLNFGISSKRILRPFLLWGATLSFLLLAHFQWGTPSLSSFEEYFFYRYMKDQKMTDQTVHTLAIDDQGTLAYCHFCKKTNTFHNLFWVKNFNEIFFMKSLELSHPHSLGYGVEHFLRKEGKFTSAQKWEQLFFDDLIVDLSKLDFAPPCQRSISKMAESLSYKSLFSPQSAHMSHLTSLFLYRILATSIPLIAALALLPCFFYIRKKRSLFFLFALSLFFLFAFFTITRSCLILGQGEAVAPFWAQVTPFAIVFGFFGRRYVRL